MINKTQNVRRSRYSVVFSPHHLLYLSWLRVDHAHNVLSVLYPFIVTGPVARATWVFADMVALATSQTQIHVADAPPELSVPTTMTTLAFLWSTPG